MLGSIKFSDYCERLGPGLWAEPVNFATNAGFLVAAWLAWRAAKRLGVSDQGAVRWLLFWLTAIGIGSGLFHSLATPWSKVCDVAPISIFVLSFYGLWNRQILQLGWLRIAWAFAVLGFNTGFFLIVAKGPQFGGSEGYFAVLIAMALLGFHQAKQSRQRSRLLHAAGAFALSLVFRTIDQRVCPAFPLGTHWLWHLLNAYVCYSALLALSEAQHARRENV